jgi:hypothetical protein
LFGPYVPAPWTHMGYEIGRLVGVMYMTLERWMLLVAGFALV